MLMLSGNDRWENPFGDDGAGGDGSNAEGEALRIAVSRKYI